MDTEEVVRSGIVNAITMGLVQYVSKTPLAEDLTIRYRRKTEQEEVVDKWNYWVFTLDTDTRLDGEESKKRLSLEGSVSADSVTPHWKTSLSFHPNYS